jgi:hypothetical protein
MDTSYSTRRRYRVSTSTFLPGVRKHPNGRSLQVRIHPFPSKAGFPLDGIAANEYALELQRRKSRGILVPPSPTAATLLKPRQRAPPSGRRPSAQAQDPPPTHLRAWNRRVVPGWRAHARPLGQGCGVISALQALSTTGAGTPPRHPAAYAERPPDRALASRAPSENGSNGSQWASTKR